MVSGVSGYSSNYAVTPYNRSYTGATAKSDDDQQQAQALFQALDTNGDNSVDEDELTSAVNTVQQSDSSFEVDIDALFSQLDSDGSGIISSAETAAAMAPATDQNGGGLNPQSLFSALDSDGSDSVSSDELLSALGDDSDDASGLALFQQLDSDGDGTLNTDEVAALTPPPQPAGGAAPFSTTDEDTSVSATTSTASDTSSSTADSSASLTALLTQLVKQYQANSDASYAQARVGSQVSLTA